MMRGMRMRGGVKPQDVGRTVRRLMSYVARYRLRLVLVVLCIILSAVASVLLGRPVAEMTGRGAGLSDAGLHRKIDAIERGIARNHPDAADPLGVLAALGGFDIAGLCGVFLGGALERLPIVMDGFISGVAALCAVRLCPAAEKAVFASHVSSEPAAHIVLDALCKKPLITAELHLGEGTGAVASLPLWDMALAVYNGCYSFAEGGITPYTPQC